MSSDHGEESDSGSETSGSCIYHSSGSTDADGRHSSNEDSNSVIAKPSSSSSHSSVIEETLATQLQLLRVGESDDDKSKEASTAPLFTEAVRQSDLSTGDANTPSSFSQWGLVGGDSQGLALVRKYGYSPQIDPRVFINVSAPLSVFICGSQGSGKSHSLSCLLENYLVQSVTNVLPRPLTGIVFYFDDLTSDAGGSPCEAAYLSSHSDIKVRVLCSRTNISNIKRIYAGLPNVQIETLRINESDLNTERMNVLMGVNKLSAGGNSLPLYMSVIERILRELRENQQEFGGSFSYRAFKTEVAKAGLTDPQLAPLQQRLETLESFMVERQAKAVDIFNKNKGQNKGATQPKKAQKGPMTGNDWSPKPGQLTIVDLSCPCVTAEIACSLFQICLSLFLEQNTSIGRFAALDEAHQFMTDSGECRSLTDGLLKTIRLQRHLGARIIISTQEPTISTQLLDLCSITIVHRFTSPAWHQALVKHLAGASMTVDAEQTKGDEEEAEQSGERVGVQPVSFESSKKLFEEIVALATGEGLVFAPSAVVGVKDGKGKGKGKNKPVYVRLGHGVLKLRMRKRVTQDGGQSIMAG